MYRHISLVVMILLAAMMPLVSVAGKDTLERYLTEVSAERYDVDITNVRDLFDGRGLSRIEGIWRMSGSDALFAVIGSPGSVFYSMIVIESEDMNLLPGTVMGALTAAGRAGVWDARIYTGCNDGELTAPKRFTITLSDDTHIVMQPVTDKVTVNLWRFLPYMFRDPVKHVNDRPKNLDGAIKLFPGNEVMQQPRYL